MATKCSKSPDGKHSWKYSTKPDKRLGNITQHRKCKWDNYEERKVTDIKGNRRWQSY